MLFIFTNPTFALETYFPEEDLEERGQCLGAVTGSYSISSENNLSLTTGPVSLNWASYYGEAINNVFNDVVVNDIGDIYAFGTSVNQGFDAVLAKFDKDGALIWTRFLGGTDADNNNPNDVKDYGKIALDQAGNVYVTGITNSSDFPTENAFQSSLGGGIDAFVAKYDSDGNVLMSSYLGGIADEQTEGGGGIAVDAMGNIFIGGNTKSNSFFTTTGAYQTSYSGGGESDIFIVKISADFSSVTGTFWGDTSVDILKDLSLDINGNVWAVGYSEESEITLNGQQTDALGDRDGLILGFDNNLSQLDYGSFYGGQFDESIEGIQLDDSGNIYICGSTFSTSDFPILNPFQNFYQGGEEGFVAKLDATGAIVWSTFLGGAQNERIDAIGLDNNDNIYVTGSTSSDDFPIFRTAQETYNTINCEQDAFVFKFNNNGTRDWATYYGGFRREDPKGIVINDDSQVFIVGKTESTDLPVSPGAHKTSPSFAGINAFVSSFEIVCPSVPVLIHSTENGRYHDQFWCSQSEVDYRHHFSEDSCAVQLIGPPGYSSYAWLKNGNPVSGISSRFYNIPDPGSYGAEFQVITSNGNGCADLSTSVPDNVSWVRPMCGFGGSFDQNELPHLSDIVEGKNNEIYCEGESINYNISAEGFCGAEFQWQKDFEDIPGETNSNYTVTSAGCYRIAIQNSFTGCTVYSETKKFIVLDSVKLNDYDSPSAESCIQNDTVVGCTSVRLRARTPHCASCRSSINGLTYAWFKDGVAFGSNSYGYFSTTEDGRYHAEVSNGNCTIISNFVEVRIRPTENPVWTMPTEERLCLRDLDSMILAMTHPDANDSAVIRFELPYPTGAISSYDSTTVVYDATAGCARIRLTTKEGCISYSNYIEFHDTLKPEIEVVGALCAPVYLRSKSISSCHLDSVLWYRGDSLLAVNNYDAQFYATEAGPYVLQVKNSCGDFYSDTLHLAEAMDPAIVSPEGPICLPVTLTADFPNISGNTIVRWYAHPTYSFCYPNVNYLIPNENDTMLIAGVPGYYMAILEDTISGCKSTCSNIVEVQRSVAGASLSPSNNVFFCDGLGAGNVAINVTPTSPSFTYQWYRNNDPITGATTSSYSTSEEGVYRAYVENSCDNSFTPTVSIFTVQNPELTIDQADTVYICGVDSITLSSSTDQPLLFQWFKDGEELLEKEDSILNLIDPGLYEVYGLNNNTQCSAWSRVVQVLNSEIINANIAISPACSNSCTGTLDATVSGGIPFANGSYQYNWSNGATTASITNLCLGTYTLTVTDFIGCSTIFSETIGDGFTIEIVLDSIDCNGIDDASLSVNTSGGIEPFSYDWDNGSSDASIQSLGAGSYEVTISDDQGCTRAENIIIPGAIPLTLDLTATEVSCFGASDAKIEAVAGGGKGPYEMTWNTTVDLNIENLSSGIYQVTLTDQKGCTLEESIEIFQPEALIAEISILDSLQCYGDSIAQIECIPTGGIAPYEYLWSTSETDVKITDLPSGNYQLTVTDSKDCSFTTDVIIPEIPALEFSFDQVENVNCNGGSDGSLTTITNGGVSPYTYLWNNGDTNAQIQNLTEGNYEVTVTDANNCVQIITQTITEFNLMTLQLEMEPVNCNGATDGVISVLVEGGNPPYIQNWDQGVDLDMLGAGWYNLTVTDQNGCELMDSIEVTEPTILELNLEILDSLKCFGDQTAKIQVTVQGGIEPYGFNWNNGAEESNLEGLAAGFYVLTVTDQNGCFDVISVEIPEVPELVLEVVQTNAVSCWEAFDGSVELSATGGTGSYAYVLDNIVQSTDGIFGTLESGTYSLYVTDGNNCSSAAVDVFIETPEVLNATYAITEVVCPATATGHAEILVSGGTGPYVYEWNNSLTDSFSNTLMAGIYTVSITDNNNCFTSIEFEIISPDPMFTSTEVIDNSCFGVLDGMIEIYGTQGGVGPYKYFLNGAPLDSNALAFRNLHEGVYELKTVDANGCIVIDELDVQMPEEMFVDLGEDQTLIFGESTSMEAMLTNGQEPFSYSWSPERFLSCEDGVDLINCNDAILEIPQNTLSYALTVTDDFGCTASDEIMIRVTRNQDQIFMPNVFTPNEDGENDFLFVQSHQMIKEIESFRIYNRWGALVFSQLNFIPNNESIGWNGMVNGQKASIGTYVFVIKYKDVSGTFAAFSGEVTLVR